MVKDKHSLFMTVSGKNRPKLELANITANSSVCHDRLETSVVNDILRTMVRTIAY